MSSHTTVHVSGIAPATSEKEVRDFFSFWYDLPSSPLQLQVKSSLTTYSNSGKIVSLSITPVSSEADAQKSASVTFEKEA